MLKIDANNKITLTRGDTAYINLNITDVNNETYEIQDSDKIVLTVKKSIFHKDSIISKIAVNGTIKFEPTDTNKLPYGTYFYDIELNTADGDVFTIIPPSKLVILEEITR